MSAEMSIVARRLDTAFHKDPEAIHSLLSDKAVCRQCLAADRFVMCESNPVLGFPCWTVSALGLLNGALLAAGLPAVIGKFIDGKDGKPSQLVGFCDYQPPEAG